MPIFKQHIIVDIARGVRAFLNLEVGVTRAKVAPEPQQTQRHWKLAELRSKLNGSSNETGIRGVNPENIVWLFGTGRSGSTWLSSMMTELQGQAFWGEPWVGMLFGNFYYLWVDERKHLTPQFILGRHKESWLRSIRNFVLDAATVTFPDLKENDHLIIKEPNGSIGAPLMMEALPESRMLLLIRDPRDVVASSMDARREGGWHHERNKGRARTGWIVSPGEDPVGFAEERATFYLRQVGNAKEAYDAHQGYKVLVKYEDLLADTLDTMKRIYSTLEIPVDEGELARAVEKHSWKNVPQEKKGEGKFYRKATPGSWKEDMTPEQVEVVEKITAPLLKEFYPYEGKGEGFLKKLPLQASEEQAP
jgi:Sulfotransferase domain